MGSFQSKPTTLRPDTAIKSDGETAGENSSSSTASTNSTAATVNQQLLPMAVSPARFRAVCGSNYGAEAHRYFNRLASGRTNGTEVVMDDALYRYLQMQSLMKGLPSGFIVMPLSSNNSNNSSFLVEEGQEALDLLKNEEVIGHDDENSNNENESKENALAPHSSPHRQNRRKLSNQPDDDGKTVSLERAIFLASGKTFLDRSADRQRLLQARWRSTGGNKRSKNWSESHSYTCEDDEKTMALIKSKTSYKYELLPEQLFSRQQKLETEINQLRKQCFDQEIRLKQNSSSASKILRKHSSSAAVVAKTDCCTPPVSCAKQTSCRFALGKFDENEGGASTGLMVKAPTSQGRSATPRSARNMLRKVTCCLDDIKEAISLISNGLEAVDSLLSDSNANNDSLSSSSTLIMTTPTRRLRAGSTCSPLAISGLNSPSVCKSVPTSLAINRSATMSTAIADLNKANGNNYQQETTVYRRTSASFSVSVEEARVNNFKN